MTDHASPIEIQAGNGLCTMTFTANGRQIVGGNEDGVCVWQIDDGRQVATMEARASCVAVSNDERWIAAGTFSGGVCLWDAMSFERVFKHTQDVWDIHAVDFSPDSARLISASENCTATLWDVPDGQQLQTLLHDRAVIAAKYSPGGDRIATATIYSVRIWDSDGASLFDILVTAFPQLNKGLDWLGGHIFVISNCDVKEIGASSGSIVREWPGTDTDRYRRVALSRHGEFIACCGKDTITFWDVSGDTPLGQIQHTEDIASIVFSPHRKFLAVGGSGGKITIHNLYCIIQPEIRIGATALNAWRHDQHEDAELMLTAAIDRSRTPNHHILACRALIRARQRKWDTALTDAKMAIEIRSSVIGYIAKSMAHIGRDEKHEAYRSCDIAVVRCHSSHTTFLLLVKAIIVFIAGDHADAISRMDDLIATVRLNSICYVVQTCMLLLHGSNHMENGDYDDAVRSFDRARVQLRPHPGESLSLVSLITGWKFDDLGITIRQRMCEALYLADRTKDAGDSLLELVHTLDEEVYAREATTNWVSGFTCRCLSVRDTNATTLDSTPTPLLREWAKATLTVLSWKDALIITVNFVPSRSTIYQAICECLELTDRIADMADCVLELAQELSRETGGERVKWVIDWSSRKLEALGDDAMNVRQHNKAVAQYSAALSLNPADPQTLLVKRSKARAIMGVWRAALGDAIDAIALDPSSPLGYERKHGALRVAGRLGDAEVAFNMMLLKMSESADRETRDRSMRLIRPSQTESVIREAVRIAIRESPLVLINTNSGHLLDKREQASSFESRPIFHELVCSITTEIDHTRIKDEVGCYYRYGMFSHRWGEREPLFKEVIEKAVQELEKSSTHDKLKMFCRIVREAGLNWAWSDTCCINQEDPMVLQESLVSMFKWYEGSALTVVHLFDAPSKRLVDCIWNSRAWTFQEYHASKVVRFYNNDWTLYRNLGIPNHKESPEIIAEMEVATGISASALLALRPGLDDIREKLRLASSRQSTRVEDIAYSLFGIFSTSLPIKYGEGDEAFGRLLAHLLMSSGDTCILAWTGESNSFNSCLPAKITVFSQSPTSHIPSTLSNSKMETIVAGLRRASLDLASVTKFYDRLDGLPIPVFNGMRMRLPCISFKLGPLAVSQSGSRRVFSAQTTSLGIVEIQTEEDLSQFKSLILVYPWIDFLLDRQPVGSVTSMIPEESVADQSEGELLPISGPSDATFTDLEARGQSFSQDQQLLGSSNFRSLAPNTRTGPAAGFGLPLDRRTIERSFDAASFQRPSLSPYDTTSLRRPPLSRASSVVESLQPPSTVASIDKQRHAFEVLARLRQPFGALLLTPDRGNVAAYKRVIAERLITVQVKEITTMILDKLVHKVGVLDVL